MFDIDSVAQMINLSTKRCCFKRVIRLFLPFLENDKFFKSKNYAATMTT